MDRLYPEKSHLTQELKKAIYFHKLHNFASYSSIKQKLILLVVGKETSSECVMIQTKNDYL